MYDPNDSSYADQAAVRRELTRTFDVCQSCRGCTDLCSSFPTLFSLLDRHDDRDAGRLTPAEQDRVVDRCHQCMLCSVSCPHGTPFDEPGVDVPRLMMRTRAMHRANNLVPVRVRVTARLSVRQGMIATVAQPFVALVANAAPGSPIRRIASAVTAVSAEAVLPPVAKERFSTWFKKRAATPVEKPQRSVAVFPSCLVEHHDPTIGHDLIKVYERNDVRCSLSDVGCCGAPLLHNGDVTRFVAIAEKNVRSLADAVRSGNDVVVAQPACSLVLTRDYPDHLSGELLGADAALVADNTYDAIEYLLQLERSPDATLDTDFVGDVPALLTLHAPCHLRVQGVDGAGRDLLELTGSEVTVIEQCSGAAGEWGLRSSHDEASSALGAQLREQIDQAPGDTVIGGCHLANTSIAALSGLVVHHPLQAFARAYGIEPEL